MRVALCLSGHMRNFKECAPTIRQNIIAPTNADVFIHTWSSLGFNQDNIFRPDNKSLVSSNTYTHLRDIKLLYNPKNIVIQPDQEIEQFKIETHKFLPHLTNDNNVPKKPYHMTSMLYKIWACNELRRDYERTNKFYYDVVIRCRPDLFFTNRINMEHLQDAINYLYVPGIENYGRINDQFAFGGIHIMNHYATMYSQLARYFITDRGEYRPEMFAKWHIEKQELPMKYTDIHYYIYR